MILKRLVLKDFRNYRNLDIEFGGRENLILGGNGSGKTNLAEAVYLLSLARSWRTNEEQDLVRDGSVEGSVTAYVREGNLRREILIRIGPEGKSVFLNGKPLRRLAELSKLVNVVLFSPSDVTLFQGSPSERRAFLDMSLSKVSADYMNLLGRSNRLLKQRNALLKQSNPDKALLEVVTDQLIQVAEPIDRYRTMYVTSLNGVLPKVLGRLRGVDASCGLVYRGFVKDDGSFAERAKKAIPRLWRATWLTNRPPSESIERTSPSASTGGISPLVVRKAKTGWPPWPSSSPPSS